MQIGFIDFSKEERNKILATLKMLDTPTALDELGIGVIRDAYADILFPGISTIQTRAKYFVLIPYLFEKASSLGLSNSSELYRWIVNTEDRLVEVLVKNSEADAIGIIGRRANKQNRVVKMKPSSIYWNGLRTFEIIRTPMISIQGACDVIWRSSHEKRDIALKIEAESYDDISASHGQAVLISPIKPDYDFMKESSINLSEKEAKYLEERIIKSPYSKDSLLAFLVKSKIKATSFDAIQPAVLPEKLRSDFNLAKKFSDFIYGAHIRYNVIFSDGEDERMVEKFQEWLSAFQLNPCNLETIFGRVTVNPDTANFCRAFYESAMMSDLSKMDDIIINREKKVKGDRSKLRKPKEYQYNDQRRIHDYKLDYRFGTAKWIIDDIIDGLGV